MTNYLEPEDDGLLMREAGIWVEEKLDYVQRYIDVFETAMRSRWPVRCYVDLMAGPGKNRIRRSGRIILGSPLLALKTRYPFTHYFYVEQSKEAAQVLRERCLAEPHQSQVDIRTGDCNVLVDDIVMEVNRQGNQSLNLAFLDPEGFELQWNTVAKLASIRRMDLIIYYPQMGLSRFGPLALQTTTQNQVDLFFGGTEWRHLFRERQDSPGLHRALINHYKDNLQKLGYQVKRGDEVPAEPVMRHDQTNAPLYRLLFASKSHLGNDFWEKITRRDVYGQTRLF